MCLEAVEDVAEGGGKEGAGDARRVAPGGVASQWEGTQAVHVRAFSEALTIKPSRPTDCSARTHRRGLFQPARPVIDEQRRRKAAASAQPQAREERVGEF